MHLAKFRQGARAPENVYIVYHPRDSQTSCKVWLASGERRRCSNEATARNPLKFAGVPPNSRTHLSRYWAEFHHMTGHMWRRYCCLTSFSDCRYMPQLRGYSPTKLCDGAQIAIFWRFFESRIFSEPRVARFRHAF